MLPTHFKLNLNEINGDLPELWLVDIFVVCQQLQQQAIRKWQQPM